MTPAPADRDDSDVDDAPLAVLEVRYNPRVQLLKLVLILCIPLLVAFAVLKTDMTDVDVATWRFLGVIVLVTLIWATAQAMRLRDRRPQVLIGPDGVDAHHWHAGTVPWENIESIAHSNSVRRGIIQQLARSRRGDYIQFRFRSPPPFVTDAPFPVSLLQRISASFEVSEPVILEYGLDTRVGVMLNAIQDHLDAWRATLPPEPATDTTPETPR
jgi:hypothetical protein